MSVSFVQLHSKSAITAPQHFFSLMIISTLLFCASQLHKHIKKQIQYHFNLSLLKPGHSDSPQISTDTHTHNFPGVLLVAQQLKLK